MSETPAEFLGAEELDGQDGEAVPEREAMSVITTGEALGLGDVVPPADFAPPLETE